MKQGLVTTFFCLVLSLTFSLTAHYTNWVSNDEWWWSLLFFVATSIFSLIRFYKKFSPQKSTEVIISTVILKTILLFMAVFLYSLYNSRKLGSFSVHFIAHYILFTVFEVRYLLNYIKLKKS